LKYLNIKYLFLMIAVLTISCHPSKKIKDIDAKIIKYRVEYVDEKAGSIPTKILPSQMTLIFADHYALNTIEGFFGQFSLTYIANRKKKTVTTLLKIFDKKYYYIGEAGELPCGIDPMTGCTFSDGKSEDEFAGFKGHEKIIKQEGKPDISIYTTDEIKIKNPNNTTPYKDVNEVLLVFYSKLSVMGMILIADEYSEEVLSSKIFQIPEGYKAVSRARMEKTIEELFK
jgi:hypothetical protein